MAAALAVATAAIFEEAKDAINTAPIGHALTLLAPMFVDILRQVRHI